MGRSPCCDKSGLKKGPWTPEEDLKLTQYIQLHGPSNWRNLPKNAGLQRCGKSCRLRWINYLRPDIKRGRFSFEEEETIIQLHSILGNKWSAIAARLPGRTDNEIKNYWNTHIRKRLLRMGIDPITHSPRFDFRDLSSILSSTQLNLSNLLGLQTMLNPEFLTLLSTLLASNHQENPEYILQKIQENQIHNTQMQHMPSLRPSDHQFQIPVPEEVPSTSFLNQIPQLVQTDNMGTGNQNFQENLFTPQNYTLESLNGSQFSFDSVKLKPLLSPTPLNSSSTCINGCTEDERESYCSNMFKFEIPVESFDIDDLM